MEEKYDDALNLWLENWLKDKFTSITNKEFINEDFNVEFSSVPTIEECRTEWMKSITSEERISNLSEEFKKILEDE